MRAAVNKNYRLFNTPFHYYFDRDDNLNCYISFSIKEFLKTYSSFPEIYDDPVFSSNILNYLEFKFLLQTIEGKIIKAENIEFLNIFDNTNIITFFSKFKNTTIPQNFLVKVVVKFRDGFYDYLAKIANDEIANPLLILPAGDTKIFSKTLKLNFDKKFTNFYKPTNESSQYEFISDYIKSVDRRVKVSNLYDIYSSRINYENYFEFLTAKEEEKKEFYNGRVPITSYIKDKNINYLNFNLREKTGELDKHLDLSISLLDNLKNRMDYKKLSFSNNIFINDTRKIDRTTLLPNDTISSLQSNSCENEIMKADRQELLDSDMLYITTFLSNFDIIDINEYWANNIKVIPVYLLEILTNYNIYYLSNIDEQNLHETWKQLTKEELLQLNTGKYLCMIRADKPYIQNSIIENYFILEK